MTFLELTNVKGRKVKCIGMPEGDYISIIYNKPDEPQDIRIDYFHKKKFKWEYDFDIPEEWLIFGNWVIL